MQFQLIGNLTLHGKTNKEVFDVQGKVTGKTVTGTATSMIQMTDFRVDHTDYHTTRYRPHFEHIIGPYQPQK